MLDNNVKTGWPVLLNHFMYMTSEMYINMLFFYNNNKQCQLRDLVIQTYILYVVCASLTLQTL